MSTFILPDQAALPLAPNTPPQPPEGSPTSGRSVLAPVCGAAPRRSRTVAKNFGKRHADVLDSIDVILAHDGNLRHGDFSWFHEVRAEHATVPGRFGRAFDLTRDGFTLLAMGWTGAKARKGILHRHPFKLDRGQTLGHGGFELIVNPIAAQAGGNRHSRPIIIAT
jgi:Rha family phage regulatory protein